MIWVALVAVGMPLAANKGLMEALEATDSTVRTRAAYALARIHDRDDSTETARLEKVLVYGAVPERVAAVRGLLSREWAGGMPAEVDRRLVTLLADSEPAVRTAVIDGVRFLPRIRASELLIQEEPRAEKRSDGLRVRQRIHQAAYELGIPELKAVVLKERLGGSEFLLWRKDCTLESCLENLVMLSGLGQDVSFITHRYEAHDSWEPTFLQSLMLSRIAAAAGDTRATAVLATAARESIDAALRRQVIEWLIALPPSPRGDVLAALALSLADPDPSIRRLAITQLAAVPRRFPRELGAWLERALDDADVDVRLEAAAGMHDLGADLTPRAKAEIDPVVRAVLATSLRKP